VVVLVQHILSLALRLVYDDLLVIDADQIALFVLLCFALLIIFINIVFEAFENERERISFKSIAYNEILYKPAQTSIIFLPFAYDYITTFIWSYFNAKLADNLSLTALCTIIRLIWLWRLLNLDLFGLLEPFLSLGKLVLSLLLSVKQFLFPDHLLQLVDIGIDLLLNNLLKNLAIRLSQYVMQLNLAPIDVHLLLEYSIADAYRSIIVVNVFSQLKL